MRNANEEERQTFSDALKKLSVPATGTIFDLLENKKQKIYIVYYTSGDYESSYSRPVSAWESNERAIEEADRLNKKHKEAEELEEKKINFCSDCPLHDYNLEKDVSEELAKKRCSDFVKSEDSPDDEVFCDSEYQQMGFEEWRKYGIWEVELN